MERAVYSTDHVAVLWVEEDADVGGQERYLKQQKVK